MGHFDLEKALAKKDKVKEFSLYFNEADELPVEIYQLTKLENLSISECKFKRIPEGISVLKNLKSLSLSELPIEELPKDIFQLPQLEFLSISACKLKKLPDGLGALTKLQTLVLRKNKLKKINADLSNCKNLKRIFFDKNELAELPKGLEELDIELLDISDNEFKKLPTSIKKWKNLHTLQLNNNKLKEFPDIFDQLTQINRLEIKNNKLTALPPSIVHLKKLSNAYLEGNPFKKAPLEVLYWDDLWNLLASGAGFDPAFYGNHQYRDYYPKLRKAASPDKYRLSLYHILAGRDKKSRELPTEHLLEALRIGYRPLELNALKYLGERAEEQLKTKPLQKGCEVAILGQISFKKTEARDRLKELGLNYCIKIKKTTTHAVLGMKMKTIEGLQKEDLVLLTDKQLNDFFEKGEDQFLIDKQEENKNAKQNLGLMLMSLNSNDVLLGLELLKKGGVPKELITELFLVFKNTKMPAKVRKQAKAFLTLHGSEKLVSSLNSRTIIFKKEWMAEDVLNRNIVDTIYGTELEASKVGKYIVDWTKKGYLFWFSTLSEKKLQKTIEELIKNPEFRLDDSYFPYQSREKLYTYTKAKKVFLQKRYFKKLPEELYQFTELQILNLSHNRLTKLPEKFKTLDKLEGIVLDYNKFAEFPTVFDQMPNLKTIHIYDNPFVADKKKWPSDELYDLSGMPYRITRI